MTGSTFFHEMGLASGLCFATGNFGKANRAGLRRVGEFPLTNMPRRLPSALMPILLGMSSLCGCSRSSLFPVQLAQQIATVDRVVLTNHPSSSLAFSGEQAQKIVRAVSESKRIQMSKDAEVSCPDGFYLQFYRGTNLLAQLEGHDNHFFTSEGELYRDESRLLQAAWKAVRDQGSR